MKALLVHLSHRVRRHLDQRSVVVVGTDLRTAVEDGALAGTRVHVHHFDNPDTVRVVGSEQLVGGSHDVMRSHSHGLELAVVAVDRRDWVAQCWVEHSGHPEADAQLEKAVASVRWEVAVIVEKRW
jgi:hypothetical protein